MSSIHLPVVVEQYLIDVFIHRFHPLLLTFDATWQLLEVQGQASYYGLDASAPAENVRLIQEVILNLPVAQDAGIPTVRLANGRPARVHVVPSGRLFYLLLVDLVSVPLQRDTTPQSIAEADLDDEKQVKSVVKLRQIRAELGRQRMRLEEANSLKNALIATLSHEFRTPLTTIFGNLHLLERFVANDPVAAKTLLTVRRSASYLFALAENLLEYGRAETGGVLLNPVVVDLDELGRDLDAMFRPLALEKNLGFHVEVAIDSAATPIFDEVKLKQILINLISNALRYCPQGEVRSRLVWREESLQIEVSDTGIGIPPEYQESVFTPFNQGGHAGSKGAGLGLSIVKRLVEQLHGTLELDSTLGTGTRFSIALPRLAPDGSAVSLLARPGIGAAMQPQTALVVDDDPDVANLLDVLLTDLGFEVKLAGDAMQAMAHVKAQPPDVLLIDVGLPGLSGNEAVSRLRAHGYAGRIVTVSATATEDARDAALAAGADQYLTKPLNVEQFVRAMQRQPAL